MKKIYIILMIIALNITCQRKRTDLKLISRQNFKHVINNKKVDLFTLKNKNGLVTQITNYGGRVVSLWVPDKTGNFEDIVLGYNSIDGYIKSNEIYFGALIGRYGNRISEGKFTLNNSIHTLATNDDANHLHGGKTGFNDVVWDVVEHSDSKITLHYLSQDGEEGYPGNLNVTVIYKLTENNDLEITYKATTDKDTPVNLTHHSFFNLHGAGKGSINDHLLQINASYYTPINEGLIPTGEIHSVIGTPFDFLKPTAIGDRVDAANEQIKLGFGYDHNFVLDGKEMRTAAIVEEPLTGIVMEVLTDEPGLQFYGGNFLNGKDIGKGNLPYKYRTAFCLESQHYPNSPNQPNFPSTLLRPGEVYQSTCNYKFLVKK